MTFSYRSAGKDLRNLGFVNYPNLNSLSSAQKGHIRKLFDKGVMLPYKEVLEHPDRFHITQVSKDTAEKMRDSGYKVSKTNKAFVPKKGFDKVRITKGKVVFQKHGLKQTVTLARSGEFLGKLKKLSKKTLKNNEMLAIKIGDHSTFDHKFTSYDSLHHYVGNWHHNDYKKDSEKHGKDYADQIRADLISQMSIVEVTEPYPNKPREMSVSDWEDHLQEYPEDRISKTKSRPPNAKKKSSPKRRRN